jgi:hypothetical protein
MQKKKKLEFFLFFRQITVNIAVSTDLDLKVRGFGYNL